jgi:hypothetical protein
MTKSNDTPTERQAFRWVQKYISAFNGDPSKVTMYTFCYMRTSIYTYKISLAGENLRAQYLSLFT